MRKSGSQLVGLGVAAAFAFVLAAAPAQAVVSGGMVGVYHQAGTNPPKWPINFDNCPYRASRTCACGYFGSPEVSICSQNSYAEAEQWAEEACFQKCLKDDPWGWGEPGPTGIYSPTGTVGTPAGVLHAVAPGSFQAYAPNTPGPIGESTDFHGLVQALTQITGAPAVWLSGPADFFGNLSAAPLPGEVPVVVAP